MTTSYGIISRVSHSPDVFITLEEHKMDTTKETLSPIRMEGTPSQIDEIFSPLHIRKKCKQIFSLSLEGQGYFKINLNKLDDVVQFVCEVILNKYPELNIPFHSYWNHFQSGNVNRMSEFHEKVELLSQQEITKTKLALITISVLLEGSAGLRWRYREEKKEYSRAEGQAVACFRMFMSGLFSNYHDNHLRVDAEKLLSLSLSDLEQGFQSGENNVLVGLDRRLKLLHKLGQILQNNATYFGAENPRLGNILDFFQELSACNGNKLTAAQIFYHIQQSLGILWAGKVEISGINLGDTYIHPGLGEGLSSLIPFHKLAQWLTYSLLEPLTENGLTIHKIDELTGLAEYRNGGLLLDSGLITLKDANLKDVVHPVESELVIEWRALTITLLDELGKLVAEKLGKTRVEFPFVKVLEGGTWWAGRILAQKLREDGSPPLKVQSDNVIY